MRTPTKTMKTPFRIYKYPVQAEDAFEIEMHEGSEVLDVQVQHGQPVLWAMVNPDAPNEIRRFRLMGTGHSVEAADRYDLEHVGSFQMENGMLVFHLFEVTQ